MSNDSILHLFVRKPKLLFPSYSAHHSEQSQYLQSILSLVAFDLSTGYSSELVRFE